MHCVHAMLKLLKTHVRHVVCALYVLCALYGCVHCMCCVHGTLLQT